MLIHWERKYDTGMNKVDDQHKKLVGLINALYERIVLKDDTKALQDAMVELKLYTIFHFGTEEKLFKKYNYDPQETEEHLKQHKAFENELSSYFSDTETSLYELGYRLAEYLKKWLFSHIMGTDMKFARYVKQNHFTEISPDDIYFDDEIDKES